MNLVKKSLFLCIGVLLTLLCLQGAQSLRQVSRLAATTDDIVASASGGVWKHFLEAEGDFKQVVAFTDAESTASLRKAFADKAAALRADAGAMHASAPEELKARVGAVAGSIDRWLQLASQHLAAEGSAELPAYHVLVEERTALEAEVGMMFKQSAGLADATVLARHVQERRAYVWTAAELVAAVLLGLALGWFALKSLHRQLGADAADVAHVANAVADGDLAVTIRTQGVPEGSVMAAVQRMRNGLLQTVTRVRSISDELSVGANEIAAGNGDLSTRTEQQSAALEKTTSTMAQLDNTVRHNVASANRAVELAQEASGVALRGGQVVSQAVQTMQQINTSSKRIADITGVIDGIAFQTNILALNAAVEAARAGEQGRGFAVVASEVRSLAQRSATAAKEIKGLIAESVERVEQGSELVDRAGSTMQEVVGAIERVSQVMGEIRSASAEQSAGVAEVSQAVTQMDRATQQNAALAEQSAAAAESLKTQAEQLVQAVSFFRMEGGAAVPEVARKAWAGSERRGPDRPVNVVRPKFVAAAAPKDAARPVAKAKTGTDDWEAF